MSEQQNKPASYAGIEYKDKTDAELFQRVERAKQEWESALDALPELICVVDHAGAVVRANRTVERWRLGSVKMVAGRSLHALLHRECSETCSLQAALTVVRQQAQAGKAGERQLFDPYLGRYLRIRARPVDRLPTNQAQNVVVILHDVTETKRMEHALRRHTERLEGINAISHAILVARSPEEIGRAALEQMAVTLGFNFGQVFVTAVDPRQVMVLAAFGDGEKRFQPGLLLPLSAFGHATRGKPYSTAILPDLAQVGQRAPVEEYWMRRGMASSLRLPLTMERTQIGFLYLVAENPNAFPAGAVGLVREAAELLTIAIHQSQLYQRLHQSHKEMENLLRAKHEMVQNVSHEVRAPLALLQGYTEILQDGTLGPLTEKQVQAVDILNRKGRELIDVVDRLLTLQTIDRNRLEKSPIDLAEMLSQLGREWEFHARRNGMSVEVNVPWHLEPVQADRPLLNQVISNLVDNAVKYSPNGGTICISADECNGEIVIGVRDEGQGIAPEALADVFERFFREGNSRSTVKGVGIGLALCRAVVEAHNGRIWAESAGRDTGTTFYVALPR